MNCLSWKEKRHFYNCKHFPIQPIRMLIFGASGSGKTKLLFKFFFQKCPVHFNDFLDYNHLIFCSPSLVQGEYQLAIKAYKAGLNKEQILKIL